MKLSITETQLKKLTHSLSEDLEYSHVDDASPENNKYEMGEDENEVGEGSRTLSRTRKKRLFSKAEIMSNPNRYKLHNKKLKGIRKETDGSVVTWG